MATAAIRRIPSSNIDDIMDFIDCDGAVIVSDILDNQGVKELNRDASTLFDSSAFCDGPFFGRTTKRIHSLVAKSSACQKLVAHPFILEIMNQILAPFCEKIQINLTQGIQIWPGETAQLLHRDDSMFPAPSHPCEFMANVMWACSKFTKENGGTVLAPGSHKWRDKARRPTEEELAQAEMEPGDALLYLGSIIHAGGENRSSEPRTGIAIGYCLGWLRQYENQYLAVPSHIAKYFPVELQELLGYSKPFSGQEIYEDRKTKNIFQSFREHMSFLNYIGALP
jgi:ectoine hydroxylase-related dioxygenase (phytanoyl-CoA dioxygenase family)